MSMTITEKILAKHAGKTSVKAGELINARVDLVLGNDVTTPPAIKQFAFIGVSKVFDVNKIALVPDHFTPNKDIKSAEQVKMMRDFARKYGIVNFFEMGCVGIEHALLPELGLVLPGELVIGADSHTCTYGALGAFSTGVGSTDMAAAMATGEVWLKVPDTIKFIYQGNLNKWVEGKDLILYTIGKIGVDGARYMSMEFSGDAIKNLSMDQRFSMSNMAIEAGGKNGIIEADDTTIKYVKEVMKRNKINREYTIYKSDADAKYAQVIVYDCKDIEPQVSFPHLPSNTKPISEAAKMNVKLDQIVIGSCTNGRIEDMRIAAKLIKGRKKHKDVRVIVLPATPLIVKQMIKEGIMDIFLDAQFVVSTPTCGPCLGGHMGILAEGERALSTTNRNFVGRMGSPKSEVYLSNVAVAAASAILGRIASPEEL
jgi:3-isopropylmalate/(R)-2-methylmalate dehydratase large subunit